MKTGPGMAEPNQIYALRLEIDDLNHKLAEQERQLQRQMLYREGAQMLLGMISRYHRFIRSLGHGLAEDEVALVEQIRKDCEGT